MMKSPLFFDSDVNFHENPVKMTQRFRENPVVFPQIPSKKLPDLSPEEVTPKLELLFLHIRLQGEHL